MSSVPVITVDGPSGVGKGTISQQLARDLGWHLLDSGALYRAVGWTAIRKNMLDANEAELAALAKKLEIAFVPGKDGLPGVKIDGILAGDALRTEDTGSAASKIAALPAVREALLSKQHEFRQMPGLVADGRDMGSRIFPDARVKIFLTASAETRAERRYKQLKEKGFDVNLARLVDEIRARDERDANRPVSPMRPAADAYVIDTGLLTIDEVMARVYEIIDQSS